MDPGDIRRRRDSERETERERERDRQTDRKRGRERERVAAWDNANERYFPSDEY